LGQYSPGSILEVRLAQEANSLGITRIHLGKGDEPYKRRFASGFDYVAEGVVPSQSVRARVDRTWFQVKSRLKKTPLRDPVRRVRRFMLSTRLWLGYAE